MRTIQKLAVCLMAGTLSFFAQSTTAQAAEAPMAGINLFLQEFSVNSVVSSLATSVKSLAFADVDDYVNIRKKPDEESNILATLAKNGAASILDEKDDWYKVKSGTVTGYIKADYLVTGEEAKELSKKVGDKMATVTAKALRVRKKASTKSGIITLIPKGDTYEVTKEKNGWVKIKIDDDTNGYVSTDYIKLSVAYTEAIPVNQEEAQLTAATRLSAASSDTPEQDNKQQSFSERENIVNYALRFLGNPYRWGGTSLTRGADCSGFTQSIFENYGIDIPRTSRQQAASGRRVSIDNIKPGDLIFYRRNGSINHVALYIGNGKVISAKSRSEGIKISRYNYRTPYKAVTYIG